MKIKLEEWAVMPTRAHPEDAGLDLYAPAGCALYRHDSVTIDTGVHLALPRGTWGKIEGRSGLNIRHDIVCCGGTIDSGYTGGIRVKLYNLGERDYIIRQGDRIAQLVIMPFLAPELELAEELEETDRGAGGFGSSGR